MSKLSTYLLFLSLCASTFLYGQGQCTEDEPFLLPPTSTFCADSLGMVTINFKIYNNGDPGTYKVTFPDGSDTIYTEVTNTASIIKRFQFDCGNPPGKPLPPKPGALFYEYQSALSITRQDCVDERGDNQRGSYDFRVVPNPIIDIKTSDLTCIEEPFLVSFEGKMCSDRLVEGYEWYVNDELLPDENQKNMEYLFTEPGTHSVKLAATTFKGCNKYIYEKQITILPAPRIELRYDLDTAQLCDPTIQIVTNSDFEYADNFRWSSDSPGVTFSDPNAPNPIIDIDNNKAGIRTIRVEVSNAFCSGVTDSFRITTLRGQTIENDEDIITCTGYTLDLCSSLRYLPTPDNIRWSSDRPGVGINDSFATCPFLTFPDTGQYVMTATGADVCGEVFDIPIKVRVRDGSALEIDITDIDTICVTEPPIALLDYIEPAYKVERIEGPAVADNVFNPALVTGDVEIIVTDSCGATYPMNIHVIPQEFYEGVDLVMCAGDSIDLGALQPADYLGTGVRDNVFRSQEVGTGVYKIRFFSQTFCGGQDSLTITVQEVPKAAFEIVTDTCAGPGAGGEPIYAGQDRIEVENRSTARVLCYEILETGQQACGRQKAQFRLQAEGTYTLQQVVAFPDGACSDTLRQTFRVQMPPELDYSYSMDSTICDSLFIAFSLGEQDEDVAYNWSFSTLETSTAAHPVVELKRPIAPEVLEVSGAVTNACYTTADTFGVVLPLQFRVSFDFLNDNNTVCSDDTIWLANTSVNADNFLVTYPDGRAERELPEFLVITNTGKDVLRYPIQLRGSNISCPDETTVDTVYILPITTEAAFGLNFDDVCSSAEVQLDNASTPGALAFVYWGDGSDPQFVDDDESLHHVYDVDRDTTFTIEMVARLCGIDTFRHDILVRPTPDASFSVLAEDANCANRNMLFTGTTDPNAYGINWTFGDNSISKQRDPIHTFTEAGSYLVYCEAASPNGCVGTDSLWVDIGDYDGPPLDFSASQTICTNAPFALDLRAPATGWTIDYGNGFVSNDPVELPYFELGDYVLNLRATSANNCFVDTNIIVTVFPGFDADIQTATSDTIVQLGDVLDLSVNIWPPRSITEVRWAGDSITSPDAPFTTALPLNDGMYSVKLRDVHGCSAADSLRVIVEKDYSDRVFAPNVFTPNGDGVNETFAIEAKPNTVERVRYLRVLARNGGVVYECTDCVTGTVGNGWDGRLNGQPLESSVYIWTAEVDFVDGTSQLFTGDITLLR